MARVTIENCMDKVKSRFALVVLAAERVKEICSGSEILIPRQNDKNPVVALREIADGFIDPDVITQNVIKKYRSSRYEQETDLPDEHDPELLPDSAEIRKEMQTLEIEDEELAASYEDVEEMGE